MSRALGGARGEVAALVALSSRRLPLAGAESLRSRLRELTRALPGSASPDRVADSIDECPAILLLEPHPVSLLWAQVQGCWREKVFVADTSFLAFAAVARPLRTIRGLARRARLLLTAVTGARAKPAVAALLLDVAYESLFAEVRRMRAVLLASNSFATEVLRAHLLCAARCDDITEVLHGVPTFEFAEYLAAVVELGAIRGKHRFVPQVRGLPLYGVFAQQALQDGFAISTAANRYVVSRGGPGAALIARFEQEYARLMRQRRAATPAMIVFIGANSHDRNYLASDTYRVERALLLHVHATLRDCARPFVLIYAPHPVHEWAAFAGDRFFTEHEIELHPDTTFACLIADACIALHSSALFDAEFTGARVFTPLLPEDAIYPAALLDRLAHPAAGQQVLRALAEFLIANARPGQDPVHARIHERAGRLWSVVSPERGSSRSTSSAASYAGS